jgi:tetratricopeptide (TPR) repeat protein
VQGDLPRALQEYRGTPAPSAAERVYAAGLWLAFGEGPRAAELIEGLETPSARALRRLMSVVQNRSGTNWPKPMAASEWMAESYYFQSRSQLDLALAAAREAVRLEPKSGFAWSRVAELEFGFGRSESSRQALGTALELSPQNAQAWALQGFVHAAQNRNSSAFDAFERAVALDAMLPTAWLGRGLIKIRLRDTPGGRRDLQAAAALQPTYAIYRSYLGKAFAQEGNTRLAQKDLALAQRLDPNDPTAWLYSALLRQQRNEINAAIRDLEQSQDLNDNRSIYRSRLLLDQDRAVRSANLANIYLDAGMVDVSVREAARAVSYDSANYSAHLFLADSYDALRDPTRFNLRYETVWFNELLLANILAPVGGARLAQGISAQEYSRLFEADRLGLASSSQVRSDGIFRERTSQYGTFGNTGYALDLDYQYHNGVRPNNELDSIEWYSTIKHQVTPQDSALVLVKYEDYHSGDNFQYYDPRQARRHFNFDEYQDPILVGAWHHEWSPGMHTMFLGGRLVNEQRFSDRNAPAGIVLLEDASGTVDSSDTAFLDVNYRSRFEIYSAELNQICDWNWVALSVGGRYQAGTFETENLLSARSLTFLLDKPAATASIEEDFERVTGYGYLTVKPVKQLLLTGGIAYDRETLPTNFRHPPLTTGEDHRSQLGPKAAFVWNPLPEITVRGIYTRSLGGVSLDESYRLEPTQLAGFPQAFRTLISESVPGVGSVAAPKYETFGLALDLKLKSRTYLGIQAERLTADVRRSIGAFVVNGGVPPAQVTSIPERLDYEENTLAVTVNQLLGEEFAVGARYALTRAELDDKYSQNLINVLTPAHPSQEATLHRAMGYVLFNHASGFFARAEVEWYSQQNGGYGGTQPGDEFFQENIYVGYRFARNRGELRLGVLNLSDEDYRLNPLTVYEELPRERVFEARLSFMF